MSVETLNLTSNVDEQGNWSAEIFENLNPGLHTLEVSDDLGNTDSALLFITEEGTVHMGDQVTVLGTNAQKTDQGGINWILIVIIGIVFLVNAYIALKIRHEETGKHKIIRKLALGVALTSFALFLGLGTYGIYKGTEIGDVQNIAPETITPQPVNLINISGTLTDPVTNEPIAGVNLSAGEVTITTGEAGQFVFSSINMYKGIKMNHPLLHKSVVFMPQEEGRMNMYFAPEIFNELVAITYAESQNKINKIRSRATESMQKESLKDIFAENYKVIHTYEDISDQDLVITSMKKHEKYISILTGEKFNNTITLTIKNGDKYAERTFVQEEESWKLVL